ncbi:MAG: sodium-dependent bicarbonate transport family permease, partial [Bacteroidia bacterium]
GIESGGRTDSILASLPQNVAWPGKLTSKQISMNKKLNDFLKNGWYTLAFGIIMPLINGSAVAFISSFYIHQVGSVFMLAVLAASASYIAVPAAMKIAVPKANPGIYLPMALAVTFPVNITFGLPLYLTVAQWCC